MKKNCKACGKEFEVLTSNQQYCSRACRLLQEEEENRYAKWASERRQKSGNKTLECKICGLHFHNLKSHVEMAHQMQATEYVKKFGGPMKVKTLKEKKSYKNRAKRKEYLPQVEKLRGFYEEQAPVIIKKLPKKRKKMSFWRKLKKLFF